MPNPGLDRISWQSRWGTLRQIYLIKGKQSIKNAPYDFGVLITLTLERALCHKYNFSTLFSNEETEAIQPGYETRRACHHGTYTE